VIGKPPVTLVIFDVDGTLVDSQDFIVEAQRRAFTAHGLAVPSREASLSIVGLSLIEAFTVLVGEEGPVASLAQAYRDQWTLMRADPNFDDPLFPGAEAAVSALAARPGIALGLATGKTRRGISHLFERTGWQDFFATVQTADEHPSKPAPDMVAAAMAETGASPQTTFMIGDTAYDMLMARAAGAHPIGVAWGYHATDELRASGAERIVENFDEILALVEAAARDIVRGEA